MINLPRIVLAVLFGECLDYPFDPLRFPRQFDETYHLTERRVERQICKGETSHHQKPRRLERLPLGWTWERTWGGRGVDVGWTWGGRRVDVG